MTAPFHEPADEVRICGACCTRLVGFGVTIGGHRLLRDIHLHLHCGEMLAVIGPNGAGKTTLLRAILGEIPHTGQLTFTPFRAGSRRPRIGYVPQRLDLDRSAPATVLDLFAAALTRRPLWLGISRSVRTAAEGAFRRLSAPVMLDDRLGQLSGGQLQLVLLALALATRPDILLLDEPMSGVDESGISRFYEAISKLRREYDLAILMVSHDLDAAASVADRMALLGKGTILREGSPREVLNDPATRSLLGYRAEVRAWPAIPKETRSPHSAESGGPEKRKQ